ncbi:PadR family transcriptional regulator [Longimycelium tulufanense]|uniref:PadR family transcriptional regulator n=1 Tax=Longimycelium tulufanense TaxID=907463 RepID=A0A8J3CH82_9PSEU|nr:PadR family transcriptional regulator [Longimycelium tulufanense]GGM69163.1 PadR family transcriptional regulator [Longimycelium tulufanense]
MSIAHTLLGLLRAGPKHGHDLKREYDARFGHDRPLPHAEIHAALARLLRDGLIDVETGGQGGAAGKQYTINDIGAQDLERWLDTPEKPEIPLRSTVYAKVVVALLNGRSAADVLEAQRVEHARVMRRLVRRKAGGDPLDQLICDHALSHMEADLRWLEATSSRLDRLVAEVGG